MKIFDTVTDVIKQGGKRRGANMGILRVDHPDILEFITLKADPTRLRNFNVSVAATTKFMRAARLGGVYAIVNPRTGRKVRSENARQMFDLIVSYAWKTGDPGIVFIDEINRRNPTRHIGAIESTNPCGEVPLHPYESCNLASINLTKFVEGMPTKGKMNWERLREAVRLVVRFLDNLIDMNKFPSPEVEKMTKANRRIGLGVMGFAEALILMGIRYDSLPALAMAARIMSFIEKEGHRMSQELGRARGSFPNFRGSLWERKGYRAMRNATVTTIAPTGTISIITGCSSGIEPLFAVSFVRNVMEGTRLLEANKIFEDIARRRKFFSADLLLTVAKTGSVQGLPEVPKDVQKLFRTALEIPPIWHVRMQAVFQRFTDNAVSKTINLSESATSDDVRAAYLLAYKLKCKGITIYRYGSKPDQVLSIGALEKGAEDKHVTVDSEFAGGCPAGVCAYATT
jgi:ribonucleoside-diphosphate reductase alpha chain